MREIGITEARRRWHHTVRCALSGTVTITKRGKSFAILYRVRRARAAPLLAVAKIYTSVRSVGKNLCSVIAAHRLVIITVPGDLLVVIARVHGTE